MLQGQSQIQFSRQKSIDYDLQESKFAAPVVAAAFAIHSLKEEEEENRRKRREEREKSKSRNIIAKEERTGQPPVSRPSNQEQNLVESDRPTRMPSRSTFMRLSSLADQRPKESFTTRDVVQTEADSWEASQLQKVNTRYEKMKSDILDWENAKKKEAKLRMDQKRVDFEERMARNLQHYQNKVARIEMIAGDAQRQLEEKRRKEESEVKEKAKYKKTKRKKCTSWFYC